MTAKELRLIRTVEHLDVVRESDRLDESDCPPKEGVLSNVLSLAMELCFLTNAPPMTMELRFPNDDAVRDPADTFDELDLKEGIVANALPMAIELRFPTDESLDIVPFKESELLQSPTSDGVAFLAALAARARASFLVTSSAVTRNLT